MRIRVLADDLTGALDTSACLVLLAGPLPVVWDLQRARRMAGSFAFDIGTREAGETDADGRVAEAAPLLANADIAYLKCDSLLRGMVATQIERCLRTGLFDHCIIAPAFPAQGRITKGGRQFATGLAGNGGWQVVGPDLPRLLAAFGRQVALRRPDQAAPPGVSFWDAERDDHLARVADAGRSLPGRVLWCGAAGLAAALAGTPPPAFLSLPPPLLALIGSDHAVTAAQVTRATGWHVVLDASCNTGFAAVAAQLQSRRVAVVTAAVPNGMGRAAAARHIGNVFARAVRVLPRPGTLFVTGGETLRGVCEALSAESLTVRGEIGAGLPVSRLEGGRWAGIAVVSKSGAFGDAETLSRLTAFARE